MTGRPPERRVIRLFPEYSRDWPLWENSTPTWDVGYATTPELYGLSEHLTRELFHWNQLWESHFDHETGWDSAAAREHWRMDGEHLAAQLREEVASFADVLYEPWPIDGLAVRHGWWVWLARRVLLRFRG